jgi:hypothetical protein
MPSLLGSASDNTCSSVSGPDGTAAASRVCARAGIGITTDNSHTAAIICGVVHRL